jgi:hypothetical protein
MFTGIYIYVFNKYQKLYKDLTGLWVLNATFNNILVILMGENQSTCIPGKNHKRSENH